MPDRSLREGTEAVLVGILVQAAAEQDWRLFERAAMLAGEEPSSAYVDPVAAVLDDRPEDVDVEDLVSVLGPSVTHERSPRSSGRCGGGRRGTTSTGSA